MIKGLTPVDARIDGSREVASDVTKTAEELETLCVFDDYATATRLSNHPNSTASILRKIFEAHSDVWNVVSKIVSHTNTPDDVLLEIIETWKGNNSFPFMLQGMVSKQNTSVEILEAISSLNDRDDSYFFRMLIAHPNISEKILHELVKNRFTYIRDEAIKLLNQRGVLIDWPVEWVEAQYGIKIRK